MDAVADALESPELRMGLAFGLGAVLVLLLPMVWRRAAVVVGVAVVAAVIVGLDDDAVGSVGFAATVLVLAAATVAARGLPDVEEEAGPRPAAAMVIISAVGVWAAVPDTEPILLVGGVLVPPLVLLAAKSRPLARSWVAAVVFVVPILWAAAEGGQARPGSVVGGVACMGLLLTEPLVRRYRSRQGDAGPLLVLLHGATVSVASRIAARPDGALEAAVIAVLTLAVAGLVSAWVPPLRRRRTRRA